MPSAASFGTTLQTQPCQSASAGVRLLQADPTMVQACSTSDARPKLLTILMSCCRLEVVHLESFLDGQARAGKQRPLEGSGFKREGSIEYDLIGT